MKMPICARCGKNVAVVFITKMENGRTTNEGLCLKCARDLGIKPAGDLMKKFGITDEDVENMTRELTESEGMLEELMEGIGGDREDGEEEEDRREDQPSRAPAMPFFNLMRQAPKQEEEEREERGGKRK